MVGNSTDKFSTVKTQLVFVFLWQVFMQISDKLKVLETVLEYMYDEINIDDGEVEEEITGDREETDDDNPVEKGRDEL